MDSGKEIMVLLSSAIPEEDLVDQLYNKIMEYRAKPTKESFREIAMFGQMVLMKVAIGDDPVGGTAKLIEDLKRSEDLDKMMNPTKS